MTSNDFINLALVCAPVLLAVFTLRLSVLLWRAERRVADLEAFARNTQAWSVSVDQRLAPRPPPSTPKRGGRK